MRDHVVNIQPFRREMDNLQFQFESGLKIDKISKLIFWTIRDK